jgi:hypothetical protein
MTKECSFCKVAIDINEDAEKDANYYGYRFYICERCYRAYYEGILHGYWEGVKVATWGYGVYWASSPFVPVIGRRIDESHGE